MADAKQLMDVANQVNDWLNICPPRMDIWKAHQRLMHFRERIRQAGNDQAFLDELEGYAERIWPEQTADVRGERWDDDDKD
jgi:hypothetical protein